MKLTTLAVIAAVLVGVGACDGAGTRVLLEEQIFELPSLKPLGSGCSSYELEGDGLSGGSGGGASGGHGDSSGLTFEQHARGTWVLLQIKEGDRLLVERSYDEAFFRSGGTDEVAVEASSGARRLARYRGSLITAGASVSCAPGPRDQGAPP